MGIRLFKRGKDGKRERERKKKFKDRFHFLNLGRAIREKRIRHAIEEIEKDVLSNDWFSGKWGRKKAAEKIVEIAEEVDKKRLVKLLALLYALIKDYDEDVRKAGEEAWKRLNAKYIIYITVEGFIEEYAREVFEYGISLVKAEGNYAKIVASRLIGDTINRVDVSHEERKAVVKLFDEIKDNESIDVGWALAEYMGKVAPFLIDEWRGRELIGLAAKLAKDTQYTRWLLMNSFPNIIRALDKAGMKKEVIMASIIFYGLSNDGSPIIANTARDKWEELEKEGIVPHIDTFEKIYAHELFLYGLEMIKSRVAGVMGGGINVISWTIDETIDRENIKKLVDALKEWFEGDQSVVLNPNGSPINEHEADLLETLVFNLQKIGKAVVDAGYGKEMVSIVISLTKEKLSRVPYEDLASQIVDILFMLEHQPFDGVMKIVENLVGAEYAWISEIAYKRIIERKNEIERRLGEDKYKAIRLRSMSYIYNTKKKIARYISGCV